MVWQMQMYQQISRLGFIAMTISSIGVALFSLRYFAVLFGIWPIVGPEIRSVIEHGALRELSHMLVAPVALLLGPFQFMAELRARRPSLHRWLGRVYVVACVVGGLGGLASALHATGGPVAGFGFGLLAVVWISVTLGAWMAAMQRNFSRHRLLMRFSFALTFAAVTLRLQIPIGVFLGYSGYVPMSPWLAFTCWIPNLIAVAIYSALHPIRPQLNQA